MAIKHILILLAFWFTPHSLAFGKTPKKESTKSSSSADKLQIIRSIDNAHNWLSSQIPKLTPEKISENSLALLAMTMLGDKKNAQFALKNLLDKFKSNSSLNLSQKSLALYAMAFSLKAVKRRKLELIDETTQKETLKVLNKELNQILELGVRKKGEIGLFHEPNNDDQITTLANLYLYFLFQDLLVLDPKSYKKVSQNLEYLKTNIMPKLYDKEIQQLGLNINDSILKKTQYLPNATLGAIFLNQSGHKDLARKSLRMTRIYENIKTKPRGHHPYVNAFVYEKGQGEAIYSPMIPTKDWSQLEVSWWEGTLLTYLASRKVHGNHPGIFKKIKEFLLIQKTNGSFPEASKDVPGKLSMESSLLTTSWFIIVSKCFLDKDWNGIFLE